MYQSLRNPSSLYNLNNAMKFEKWPSDEIELSIHLCILKNIHVYFQRLHFLVYLFNMLLRYRIARYPFFLKL